MSIQSKASTIIENNWEAVKADMRHTWRKLKDSDVAKINSYKDLVAVLQKTYDIAEEDAINKIDSFIDKLSLEPNLTRLQELKEALYESASDASEKIGQHLKSSVETIQEKTSDIQSDVTTYVKENPLKVLGLGVLAAVAIKELVLGRK